MKRLREFLRHEGGGLAWRLRLARLLLAPFPEDSAGRIRPRVLRAVGFRIGSGTIILGTPRLTGPAGSHRRLVIGRNCFVNVGCLFESGADILIGDNVALAHEVMVITTSHHPGDTVRRSGIPFVRPVKIGAGVWLGARSLVLPGVTIGPGAIIAAGAVVNRDVPPDTLVGGVPARVIRHLDPDEVAPPAERPSIERTG